jgi:hypothetical protein
MTSRNQYGRMAEHLISNDLIDGHTTRYCKVNA